MNIREAYQKSLECGGHEEDAAQKEVVEQLQELQERLVAATRRRNGVLAWLGSAFGGNAGPVTGIYLWGGVGRGKTYLMDLFFETLAIDAKRRIHFHRMMHAVHSKLAEFDNTEDPIDKIAEDIAAGARVLCFDEFFVSDIGDAMILGRLLDGLFRRGVTLVATSNTKPSELYRDGLQRQRFEPAIELIQTHTRVIQMSGDADYRLRLLQRAGTFLSPDDDTAQSKLQQVFDESASSQIRYDHDLDINGRSIRARCCAKGIVWFDFDAICDGPRSQNDYIEIARWYPTVIVSGVPTLDRNKENQTRRFIALVDEFYERRVKLLVSSDTDIASLYSGRRLAFEFERTKSRLVEMQSGEYLAAAHLA